MKIYLVFITCILLFTMDAATLEAGAAKADITAPIGTPLSGYGARMGRDATSVHDPIWSRALYLDDENTKLFLVSVDLIGITPELRSRVLELAPDVVPKENIILSATHTHSGQGATVRSIPIRFVSGRFIPEVLESTAQGIVESMRNAYDKRKRAALGYAAGKHQGLSANRRYSGGPIDEQVGVIVIEDADGNPISIITNFAAHPTSIEGADFYAFSADYPGFYYLEMEELMGPDCIPIFWNGAQGNQTTGNPENKKGWERTEWVGRQLAQLSHKIAESIVFGEVELHLAQKSSTLPLTLSNIILPEKTELYALEINDLCISFIPGEACVELALTLRKRALSRGYQHHFTVGLSNDHLMYFVPRHLYPDPTYESASTFFGPGIEDWFYDEFESMMTKNNSPAQSTESENQENIEDVEEGGGLASLQSLQGCQLMDLTGKPQAMGNARGDAFVADIQSCYEMRVMAPIENKQWLPDSGMWSWAPSFLNTTPLALTALGMGSRSLLQGLSMELIREMEGMAEGARMPFDAFWLLQQAPLYTAINDKSSLFSAPLCTMFAAVGSKAGADDLLVGRNLDWAFEENALITRMHPDAGHSILQVGFSWNAGVFTAMNDTGLVVCVERVQTKPPQLPNGAPLEFLLRDMMQNSSGFTEALAKLKQFVHIRDMHVLIAGFDKDGPHAAVVEYGDEIRVRQENNGLLLGVLPDNAHAPTDTILRYESLLEKTEPLRIIGDRDIQRVLSQTSSDPDEPMASALWNAHTKHSVVFLPKSRTMQAAFPGEDGKAGSYNLITVKGDSDHE